MQFVDVTNDVAFRKIFGQQEKKEVLISFLNAIIILPNNAIINDIAILNPYQLPLLAEGKTTILDIKAKDSLGNTFIVEMQVAQNKAFHKRVLYYTSQSYSQQIKEGDDYSKLFPVYFVGILNFPIGNNNNYLSTHKILNVETNEHVFMDVSFHIIELIKFNKKLP
jgi:predicted transposase/invertase (TIGR01784 family)